MKSKSVLIIAGSDSSAGAGIQADLKTFTMHKVYASTVITALTAQNTQGVDAVYNIESSFIEKQIKSVSSDLDISHIKIGMLSNLEIMKTVNDCILKYLPDVPIILDTVMVAKGGHRLLEKNSINYLLKNIIPKSYLITPNIPEAEEILGFELNNLSDMKKGINKFREKGISRVLLKGGHLKLKEKKIYDILLDNDNTFIFESMLIETLNTHGTGCSLASAVASNLCLGYSLKESVTKARNFIYKGIMNSIEIGNKHNPINHYYKLF